MRIVYLIAATHNPGGMERVLTNKVNWLVSHGYEVSIITTDQRSKQPYFELNPSVKCYDLNINYDANNGSSVLSKLLAFPIKQYKHRCRLENKLKELRPDVTVCMFNNDVSFVYKLKDGSRKLLEVHFSKYKKLQYSRKGLWGFIDRWRTKREERYVTQYEKFVVLTEEDKALWGHLPNICVIPNARTFNPVKQADLSQKHVLAIGRYDYQKGFDILLNIWEHIKDVGGWTLDIVGDGPLHEAYTHQITNVKHGSSVRLLKPTSDIQSIYLQSSVLVMTSRYEGLPMVLLEAQAFGLPIIAFTCKCGPREIVTNGRDGYLVDEGDTQTFAERLSFLIKHEDTRRQMGAEALQSSERFAENVVMQKWVHLLNSKS